MPGDFRDFRQPRRRALDNERMSDLPANLEDTLFGELKDLIVRARERVAVQVNQALVMTYWQIGRKLSTEVLQGDSHRYGEATMTRLAERLTLEFGRGFSHQNLYRMGLFFQRFPDQEIVSTLSRKFSWSHFLEFIKIEDPLKRDFFVQVCSSQAWSVRQLRKEMGSLLFERTMLSRQPEGVIRQELANLESNPAELSPKMFLKDPYLLDFLDLNGPHPHRGVLVAVAAPGGAAGEAARGHGRGARPAGADVRAWGVEGTSGTALSRGPHRQRSRRWRGRERRSAGSRTSGCAFFAHFLR